MAAAAAAEPVECYITVEFISAHLVVLLSAAAALEHCILFPDQLPPEVKVVQLLSLILI